MNTNKKNSTIELLPIQRWFFKYFKNVNFFNQAFLIKTPFLDKEKLKRSLNKLVKHHGAFRIKYKKTDTGEWTQYYDDSIINKDVQLNLIDLKEFKQADGTVDQQKLFDHLTELQNKFDIEKGPLYSVAYITGYDDGSARIWIGMHHLVIDAVSWRIICEDLQRVYNGRELINISVTYGEWTEFIKNYTKYSPASEINFWKTTTADLKEFTDSVYRNNQVNKENIHVPVILDEEKTSLLVKDCPHLYGVHINPILLTALAYALETLSKSKINFVTLEGHGREEVEINEAGDCLDVNRTIGWFTIMYPVRLEVDKSSLRQTIKNISKQTTTMPNNGIGFGAIVGLEGESSPICFNYLGRLDAAMPTSNKVASAVTTNWSLTDGPTGNVLDPNHESHEVISMNGHVMKGILGFDVCSRFDQATTEKFASVFKAKLEEIVSERNNKFKNFF